MTSHNPMQNWRLADSTMSSQNRLSSSSSSSSRTSMNPIVWLRDALSKAKSRQDLEQTLESLPDDHQLTCHICYEVLHIPVQVVPLNGDVCPHAFCSLCLRSALSGQKKHVQKKAYCPYCRAPLESSTQKRSLSACLRPNRHKEAMVRAYKTVQQQLQARGMLSNAASSEPTRTSLASTRQAERSSTTTESEPSLDEITHAVQSALQAARDSLIRPSSKDGLTLPRTINYNQRKPLKEWSRLCRDEGLDSTGSEDVLKSRHKRFYLYYQAEMDAVWPRSHAQLVHDFGCQERKRQQSHTPSPPPESQMKEGFAALIQQVQRQRQQQKAVSSTKLPADEESQQQQEEEEEEQEVVVPAPLEDSSESQTNDGNAWGKSDQSAPETKQPDPSKSPRKTEPASRVLVHKGYENERATATACQQKPTADSGDAFSSYGAKTSLPPMTLPSVTGASSATKTIQSVLQQAATAAACQQKPTADSGDASLSFVPTFLPPKTLPYVTGASSATKTIQSVLQLASSEAKGNNKRVSSNIPTKRPSESRHSTMQFQPSHKKSHDNDDVVFVATKKPRRRSSKRFAEWECRHCTLVNRKHQFSCEACFNSRYKA